MMMLASVSLPSWYWFWGHLTWHTLANDVIDKTCANDSSNDYNLMLYSETGYMKSSGQCFSLVPTQFDSTRFQMFPTRNEYHLSCVGSLFQCGRTSCDAICMRHKHHNNGGRQGNGIPAAFWSDSDTTVLLFVQPFSSLKDFKNGSLDFCEEDALITHRVSHWLANLWQALWPHIFQFLGTPYKVQGTTT